MNMKSRKSAAAAAVSDTAAAIFPLVDALAAALESGESHIDGEPRLVTLAAIRAGIARIAANAPEPAGARDTTADYLFNALECARSSIDHLAALAIAVQDATADPAGLSQARSLASCAQFVAEDAVNAADAAIDAKRANLYPSEAAA